MPGPAPADRPPVTVRLATLDDAAAVCAIYNHEVQHHTSTFDLVTRSLADQREWLAARRGAFAAVVAVVPAPRPDDGPGERADEDPRSAAKFGHGEVVGFAALSPYKERAAYATTVENSVYVARERAGEGIGRALMDHLVEVARSSGFHSIIARIEASSTASRALHAACGFELVGVEREVGRKFRRWLDVAVMQLML